MLPSGDLKVRSDLFSSKYLITSIWFRLVACMIGVIFLGPPLST